MANKPDQPLDQSRKESARLHDVGKHELRGVCSGLPTFRSNAAVQRNITELIEREQ